MKFPHTARCKQLGVFPVTAEGIADPSASLHTLQPVRTSILGHRTSGSSYPRLSLLQKWDPHSSLLLVLWAGKPREAELSETAPPQPCFQPHGSRQEEVSQGGLPFHLCSLTFSVPRLQEPFGLLCFYYTAFKAQLFFLNKQF